MTQLREIIFKTTSVSVSRLHLAEFYNNRGTEKADNGEFQRALEDFSKAISLNPDEPKFYFNRASIKVDIGDVEGARKDFDLASHRSNNIHHFL